MTQLISMVDFVLEDNGIHEVVKYANFLKQPLEIWMFDKNDERCLFEGFEVRGKNWLSNGNIDIDEEFCQDLSIQSLVKYNLQLTPTALKK